MNKEDLHKFRKEIDVCIKKAKKVLINQAKNPAGLYSGELSMVTTKLREAKMWVGECLKALGEELPEEFRDESPKPGTD